MIELEGFADRFDELLKYLKLTTTQFADIIGQSSSKISKYRRGVNWPSIEFLMTIHKWFPKVNIDYMVTGRGKLLLEERETELSTYEQTPVNQMVTEEGGQRIQQLEEQLAICRNQVRDKERIIQLLEKSDGK